MNVATFCDEICSSEKVFGFNSHVASINFFFWTLPVDTGRKLNVYKTFRRRPGRLLNVLCTFNLRHVSTGPFLFFFLLLSDIRLVFIYNLDFSLFWCLNLLSSSSLFFFPSFWLLLVLFRITTNGTIFMRDSFSVSNKVSSVLVTSFLGN